MTEENGGVLLRPDGSLERVRLPSGRTLDGEPLPHVRLQWEDGSVVDARGLRWTGEQDGRSFSALAPERVSLDITAEPDPHGLSLLWKLTVRNRRRLLLDRVDVTLLALEGVPPGWLCTLPFGGGWAVRMGDFAPGTRVSLRYPVQCSMQWVEVCGEDEGVSLHTRDPVPWLKDLVVERTESGVRVTVSHGHLRIAEGEELRLPPLAIGPHRGDWQEAAAIYSGWLRSVMPEPAAAPGWLYRAGGWAWVSGKGQYAERPDNVFSDLPRRSEQYAGCGVECLQLAAWFEHGHDTHYPDYVAGESLGGEEGLADALEAIHRSGRRMALYTNARLLDPLSETARQHPQWTRWAVQAPPGKTVQKSMAKELAGVTTDVPLPPWDPDDRLLKEIYGKVVFAVMCPGASGWRETFAGRLERAALAYRPDGFYLDQVLGAVAPPCFGEGHGHSRPYEAWARYREFVAEVRARIRRVVPEAYLATEGISDILSAGFDVVQSHNDWRGPCPEKSFPLPEMTRHAMPWLAQANGAVYAGRRDLLALAHACASLLDLACFSRIPEGEFAEAIRFALDVRRRSAEQMRRAVPVRCRVAGFPKRRAMALAGDALLVFCAAPDGASGDYDIRLELPARRITPPVRWESPSGGGVLPVDADGGGLRLRIPACELGFVHARLHPAPNTEEEGLSR